MMPGGRVAFGIGIAAALWCFRESQGISKRERRVGKNMPVSVNYTVL